MPIFVYLCPCGSREERFVHHHDQAPPKDVCAKCGKKTAERQFANGLEPSNPIPIFKGQGFYVTENRSAAYKVKGPLERKADAVEKSAEISRQDAEAFRKRNRLD